MKKSICLYQNGSHAWHSITRDPNKPNSVIDTNEYCIINNDRACVLDPGGTEVFPAVFSALGLIIDMNQIDFLFASHQDPDIISSLPLWVTLKPDIKCYVPWTWDSFIPHFGCKEDTLIAIPDEGTELTLGQCSLQAIPAHYLHSSGNFHLYDPLSRILFTGDIGAALLPQGSEAEVFVKDFDQHTQYMKAFHQRWMPSNEAKNAWVERVSKLKIDMICPQHGSIFKDQNVELFLNWLHDLRVGESAIAANRGHIT